ncbi:MAG: hypothetical protein ACK56I_02800, partial [bacterium]
CMIYQINLLLRTATISFLYHAHLLQLAPLLLINYPNPLQNLFLPLRHLILVNTRLTPHLLVLQSQLSQLVYFGELLRLRHLL